MEQKLHVTETSKSGKSTLSHWRCPTVCCPLTWLVFPRWYPSHPDGVPPLHRGAAEGQGHPHVSGQQGLPLRLESVLEGRRQQQQLGCEHEPLCSAEGRPLQLEQHPDARCRPVGEGELCDLWGHPGLPDSSLRDSEDRPVFPVLTWLTGTLIQILFCCCSQSICFKSLTDFILKVFVACNTASVLLK